MSDDERDLYEAVEEYISKTYIVRPDCYRLERQLPGGVRTR